MLRRQKFLLLEGRWQHLGSWDVAQEGQPRKAEQKDLEREVRKLLSAEDGRLGEALPWHSCLGNRTPRLSRALQRNVSGWDLHSSVCSVAKTLCV